MNYYLFGLQRSGTNLVHNLIKDNYGLEPANSGHEEWKHSMKPALKNDYPIFKVIKNPYTWVESIVYRERADFYEKHDYDFFQPGPFMVEDVNLNMLMYVYKTWYDQWKDKGILIKYEDILYPDQQREYFAKHFGDLGDWKTVEPGSMFMCEDFKEEHLEYYEKQRPTKLTGMHVKIINKVMTKYFFIETGFKMLRVKGLI